MQKEAQAALHVGAVPLRYMTMTHRCPGAHTHVPFILCHFHTQICNGGVFHDCDKCTGSSFPVRSLYPNPVIERN